MADIGSYVRPLNNIIVSTVVKRLCRLNQKTKKDNLGKGIAFVVALAALGFVYFLFAYYYFHALWYHKVLSLLSALIFMFLCGEAYFDLLERKMKMNLPDTLKKLSHYYTHYKGNVIPALEDTAARCPENNRVFIIKIKEALQDKDYENKIELLQEQMPCIWLKMLCRLMLFARQNGGYYQEQTNGSTGGSLLSRNIKRLANIVTYLNIEQGYSDAELLGMQVFVFLSPFFIIPFSRWYNTNLLVDMNVADIYKSIQAQSLSALILFTSNLSALFIHWMRKLQS